MNTNHYNNNNNNNEEAVTWLTYWAYYEKIFDISEEGADKGRNIK